MSIESSGFGLSRAEYEQGISERVKPRDLKVSLNYIFRWIVPCHPPYAVEMVGQVIETTDKEASDKRIHFQTEGLKSVLNIIMDLDGFIIKPFACPNEVLGQSASDPELGYLLDDFALSDNDLFMLTSKSLELVS